MKYYTTLAGVEMPQIIYGTAWKKQRTEALVSLALEQGFRGIDTACQPKHYHEPGVGLGIRKALDRGVSRDDLFIQTKFTPVRGQDPKSIPYDPQASLREQVLQSFEVSLRNIGVSVIDSLVLHSPLETYDQLMEVWKTMEELIQKGVVRQLGISNCYDLSLFTRLYTNSTIQPSVLQNRFYQRSDYDVKLRQFCRDHGVIYQSFWTLTANPEVLRSNVIQQLVQQHKKTAAQILFRYLTYRGVAPLTGTNSIQHMQDDLNIFNFELSPLECERIDKIGPF